MHTPGLTPEQKRLYDENGFVLVKRVFTRDEANDLCREAHELISRLQQVRSLDATWGSVRDSDPQKQTLVLHCHDVQFQSAAFTRMILDPRLTAIAQSIIGPNVQLHHTKLFVKPPERGSSFPLHQDKPYFPHDRDTVIAAIVHLDDAPVEKGCVRVIPGSHRLGLLPESGQRDHSLPPEKYPIDDATPCPAQAGDVLVFSYLTVHGSGVNTSHESRTTVLIQMRDPTDPPTVRTHESRGQGMMLAGFDPSCCPAAATHKPTGETKTEG
jgi:phytanoyl-CoA hydroxylase